MDDGLQVGRSSNETLWPKTIVLDRGFSVVQSPSASFSGRIGSHLRDPHSTTPDTEDNIILYLRFPHGMKVFCVRRQPRKYGPSLEDGIILDICKLYFSPYGVEAGEAFGWNDLSR